MNAAVGEILRTSLARLNVGRPYPGFRPFRRDEWPIYFGRERQVQALLGLLATHRFISVHGPSGSGKSSLIEAGLIATLQREHRRLDTAWCCATFRPGTSPLWNLARGLLRALHPGREPEIQAVIETHSRLSRPGGSIAQAARESGLEKGDNLLLVADQFEELFRFRALGNRREARHFINLLLDVFDEQPGGIHLVLATRTDFLGDCSEEVGLAEAMNAASYLTPALSEDELRLAIRGPAELHDGKVEDALVERLLVDSASELDRLPILQHALMRCWDVANRRGQPGILTLGLYKSSDIRGVGEALHVHAEEVMNSPELAGLSREVELVFRALTELDGQGRPIRRPLPWAQLLAETGCERQPLPLVKVVNRFRADGTGFLGRPGPDEKELKSDTVIDVAHEALIRRWQRLNRPATPGVDAPRQHEGWLWEQAADGNLYRALLVDAQSKGQTISPKTLDERLHWWRRQPKTTAWARRMSGDRDATDLAAQACLDGIDQLFARSDKARIRQRWWWRGGAIAVAIACLVAVYSAYKFVEQRVLFTQQLEARDQLRREDLQRLIGVSAERDEAKRQLKATADALERVESAAGQRIGVRGPPVAVPPASTEQATEVATAASPTAQAATTMPAAAAQGCKGAIWIGSGNATNLRFAGSDAGRAVSLGDVQANRSFVSGANLRLRRGLPRQDGYIHQETIGIVPVGAQVLALGVPVRYDRPPPAGPQYWLDVAVPSQVCSLVYFQFSGGTPDSARALAGALEKQGYLVPGQQQLASAQGVAEVRFYYADDRASAEQLAKDAQAAAKELGLAANRTIEVKDLTSWPRQKPPRGTLELWLDLSAR